jgi:hypothetical protein
MAKSDGDTSICFPGEDRWELWRLKSGRFELADTASVDADGDVEPFKQATHYAFPVHSSFAVPIWAGTDDPAMLGDLVDMQLEKQGLKPEPGAGTILDYRKVAAAEVVSAATDDAPAATRTLLLANVLNPNYEHPLPRSGGDAFDVSPRFLVLPGNHIIIWKELGRLVMALTRGGQLVYFQGLSSGDLDPSTVHEIRCVLLGLEGQGVAASPSGIHLWVEDVDDSAGALLQEELGLDAIVTLRPDPVLPQTAAAFLPPEVALGRAARKRAVKIRNILLACAAIYIGLVGWYLFGHFKVIKEEQQLAARAKDLEGAKWMRPFRKQWDTLEPVMDKSRYPSQLVHRVTAFLPPEGVNITSFSVNEGVISIIGECSNANSGRSFGAKLFGGEMKNEYTFEWLQRPTVDPRKKDGTATFRIQGKYNFG